MGSLARNSRARWFRARNRDVALSPDTPHIYGAGIHLNMEDRWRAEHGNMDQRRGEMDGGWGSWHVKLMIMMVPREDVYLNQSFLFSLGKCNFPVSSLGHVWKTEDWEMGNAREPKTFLDSCMKFNTNCLTLPIKQIPTSRSPTSSNLFTRASQSSPQTLPSSSHSHLHHHKSKPHS